ncbi:MAG: hypothetical protein RSG52_15245 [Terrisporobacter sp.]|uniref:hypothetical protein n=1 Tax=Clostridia TaxID=186801 RepID=UPI002FCA1C59
MINSSKFLDSYISLVDNGVRFYYSDENMYLGEVTSLDIIEDSKLEMQIEFNETHIIEIEDFLQNHTKENITYHDWENVRIFDDLLKEDK